MAETSLGKLQRIVDNQAKEIIKLKDTIVKLKNEKQAKQIADTRKEKAKQKQNKNTNSLTLDDLFAKVESGIKEINVVLKADVKGSEEAVKNALEKIDVITN